jgi:amidase
MDRHQLAEIYRSDVNAKLPRSAILPPSLIAQFPPGSDVSRVPETCGLLSAKQVEITTKDATDLLVDMAAGVLTSEEVVLAFGLRAAIAHQLVRLLLGFTADEEEADPLPCRPPA